MMNKPASNILLAFALSAILAITALWNIPHTIAARYLCIVVLAILTLALKPSWRRLGIWAIPLVLFAIYTVLHLAFVSSAPRAVFPNYWSDWFKFIMLATLGAGIGLAMENNCPRRLLLYIGAASAVPLIIHVALFIWRWATTGVFPFGYWGINDIHGDLAYTALQATAFLAMFQLMEARQGWENRLSLSLLALCFLSPFLASSRGGVAFVFFTLLLCVLANTFRRDDRRVSARTAAAVAAGLALFGVLTWNIATRLDHNRWNGLVTHLSIAFQGDPIAVNCKGVGEVRKALESQGRTVDARTASIIEGINGGDGSRVMTARAGLELLKQHPMGIDGSREAYQIAIKEVCNPPAIGMAHTHNAWVDTALAIGIPGALLLILVLASYAVLGFQALRTTDRRQLFGGVLFVLSVTWFTRAFFDGVHRNQMLEMQALLPALLVALIVSGGDARDRA